MVMLPSDIQPTKVVANVQMQQLINQKLKTAHDIALKLLNGVNKILKNAPSINVIKMPNALVIVICGQ